MRRVAWAVACLAAMTAGSARAADYRDIVAVLEIANDDKAVTDSDAATLTDQLRVAASKAAGARMNILTRESMDVLLPPGTDKRCFAGKCVAQIGQMLQAKFIVGGTVRKIGTKLSLTVETYESVSGKLLGERVFKEKSVDALSDVLDNEMVGLFGQWLGIAPSSRPEAPPQPVADSTTPVPEVAPSVPRVHKEKPTDAVGTLIVSAKPSGKVRLDLVDPNGKKSSSGSPYENKKAAPGTWTITASATGYEQEQQTSEVPADDMATLRFDLKQFGSLKVTGTPAGAAVSVTGPGGFKDDGGLPWDADGLKSGSYQVKITRTGYGEDDETVEVKPGETATVRVKLEKAAVAARGGGGSGGTKIEPKSGLEFVHLSGGTFHYGCEPGDSQCSNDEKPGKSVTVQPFWLGKTTVTVAAYARCVSAGKCSDDVRTANWPGISDADRAKYSTVCNWKVSGKENHPMNCIDWSQATAFCEWIGGRLPTAEEWEYAAKGGESRIYPWGNEAPDDNRALFGKPYPGDGTAPAESYGGGASKHGLLNMAGNIWQWTASNYDATNKEIRGGSWGNYAQRLRASYRSRYPPSYRGGTFGVRCGL